MDTYLVGGAVRDALLGLPVHERDWVVVGASAAELERQGYRQVGRDFPVFLHPDTAEEYALARTERKTGSGHTGFATDASPAVTLEEDLARRDLTINAIAQRPDGSLVDPWGGQADLEARLLRHVSPAFVEDPLRVLRVARFAARLAHLGFSVAPETLVLMQEVVASGELDTLTPERVWQEFAKALRAPAPLAFVQVLADCGAWLRLFPELGDPARPGFRALTAAANAGAEAGAGAGAEALPVRWAVLFAADAGMDGGAVRAFCARWRVPNACRDLARLVAEHGAVLLTWAEATPEELLAALRGVDALRRAERFADLLAALDLLAAVHGRPARLDDLAAAAAAVRQVPVQDLVAEGLQGRGLARELEARQLAVLAQALA